MSVNHTSRSAVNLSLIANDELNQIKIKKSNKTD